MTTDGLLLALESAPAAGGGFSQTIFLMVAFLAIFYFVVFRPQQKEQKEHAATLASLQKGDVVVTAAGLHGRVHEVKEATLFLEVAPGVVIKVERDSVKRKQEPAKVEPKAEGKGT